MQMKSQYQLVLGSLAASILCATANAGPHGSSILIDNWTPTGVTGSTLPITLDTTLAIGPSLTGLLSPLTFSPGGSGPFTVATADSVQPAGHHLYTEYAFGDVTVPDEQILIDPVLGGASTSAFKVTFNYGSAFGGAGETASLGYGGVTYTLSNPGAAAAGATEFDFSGGVIANLSTLLKDGWTSGTGTGTGTGTTSAPEIDPASMMSALTLLAGGLAIMISGKRRILRQLSI
jgi:hypothetical protein